MPPPYSSDRQLVELLIIPGVLQTLVTVMRKDLGEDADMFAPVADLLTTTMRETVATVPPGHVGKLLRRAERATRAAMEAIADEPVGVQWLAIARLTVQLAEQDYLVVGADSTFSKAWDAMAEIMSLAMEELHLEDAAERAAAVLFRRLQADGFFARLAATG
jgi:hypothetical protein